MHRSPFTENDISFWIRKGDHHISRDKLDMSFTKDWALIKIFPWRFSVIMDGLFLYHHQNFKTHNHDDHVGARVEPPGVSPGGPGP